MAITKFQFVDNLHGWTLNEVSFSKFNLLVGVSGVGKTRILRALQSVQRAGIYDARRTNGCSWALELESEGMKFLWTAETSLVVREPFSQTSDFNEDNDERPLTEIPHFISEHIVRDGEVLVARTEDDFLFNEKSLPKLKNTESAITLLRDENVIAPVNRALRRFIFSENMSPSAACIPYNAHYLNKVQMHYRDLDAIHEATDILMLVKAYILQEEHPDEFQRIKDDYSEIFDSVSDVRVGKLSELEPLSVEHVPPPEIDWLAIGVKEYGVNGWITNQRLSSGMFRILVHLIELTLSPPGTVIVIDEFENSLGVNCLPELTDRFLERSRELQFILTSHHPYIINNVPSKWWKIVTRKGSAVTVFDEASIPALKTASAHGKFILLMNLKEYEEGIQ